VRVLDLFSGIGGFSLAATRLGFEVAGQVEIDPWCRRLLAQHWPDVPRLADIHDVKGDEFGTVDLVCGGFPCQPFSVAGERRGSDDDRALWPQMLRVIAATRPRWVIGENVTGIISMELDTCLADLEGIGYSAWPVVIPAIGVDAPHRRERVWILAHDDRRAAPEQIPSQERQDSPLTGDVGAYVADATGKRQQGSGEPQPPIHPTSYRNGQASQPVDGRKQCVWEPEPGMGRVAHGVPHRVDRLKGLGNAIVPQVAQEIMRAMLGATP
jgi:DNA (cytosine-5)-methyltransferase 1